jgi:hypothetical protein
LSLSDYPLASSKPQVTGDVSPGPHLPKEKEPSHRGDIGWDRFLLRQFGLLFIAFFLATNCAITFWRRCRGTLSQTFLRRHFFGKLCPYGFYLTSLPGDSTLGVFPYLLIVSRKLSGDSTDDEANYDFTMGSRELQTFGHE